ncbi:hypothetical protein CANARDRAFT_25160 [[Candida] arabinofermentans NRRL YB-2248]|uniref:Signal peptidase complex subunit 2 n=1 Tax=[Candida] arabinofermentans NRRL YB-2248 TaxID=983967 RepID=A0A1E4SV18_9ASCO|nr:hypothetical protein CANARDRAFT_25160 [[Candida] arabinofermentans NRRL YB-2248]
MSKKININSIVALRTECDDHLPVILTKLGYSQSFALVDFKLAVGYLCVAISGLLYYLEKQYDNDFGNLEYVNYTKILVAIFFTLNSVWYLFGKFIEKDIKFVGTKGTKKLTVSSKVKSKYDPVYSLVFAIGEETFQDTIEFKTVFTEDGFLDYAVFAEKVGADVAKVEKSK